MLLHLHQLNDFLHLLHRVLGKHLSQKEETEETRGSGAARLISLLPKIRFRHVRCQLDGHSKNSWIPFVGTYNMP